MRVGPWFSSHIAFRLLCGWRRAIVVSPPARPGPMAAVVVGHLSLRKHPCLEPPRLRSPHALWGKLIVKAAFCALIQVEKGVSC